MRYVFLLLALAAVGLADNVFEWGRGLEEPFPGQPTNTDRTTTAEFLAYSRGICVDGAQVVFRIPREDGKLNYRYVGLGPFPVAGLRRYALATTFSKPRAENAVLALATFFAGDTILGCYPILNLPANQYAGFTAVQDFGTPPGADRMILWLGLSAMGKGPLRPGDKLVFTDVAIRELRPLVGGGVLATKDFAELPVGPLAADDFYPGSGDGKLDAAIVDIDGNRCLRLVKQDGQYNFPHFRVPGEALDNGWYTWRFRARGNGRIAAGLWFALPDNSWHYGCGNFVDLTDAWQEVTYGRVCVDPSVRGFGAAFHLQSPTGEFVIDELRLERLP